MMNFVCRMLLVLLSVSAFAQQPAKINIQGVVTAAGSNEPIAGAHLGLTKRTGDPVISDSRGRFEFKNLEPGEYGLTVMANGYVRQHIPASTNMTIRMTPAGTVSGRILETSGRPAANVPVELLHWGYTAQGRRLQDFASTQSNDLGEYRFYGVTPGRYYLAAGHKSASDISDTFETSVFDILVADGRNSVGIGYSYTQSASVIDVPPGARLDGLDLNVSRLQKYRIQGRVIDSRSGRPPSQIVFTGSFGRSPRYDPKTGIFEFPGMIPGRYPFSLGSDSRRASAIVVVGNADVDGLSLTLDPVPRITGKIRTDGGPLPEGGPGRMLRVALRPQDPEAPGGGSTPILDDGSLLFDDIAISAEPHQVQVPVLPAGFYVKEARLDGVDVLNGYGLFSRGGNLEIVVSSKVGQVKGVTKPRVQVVLVPDKLRSRSDLYKTTTADGNGGFTFQNVPLGDYKVFAWERVEPFAYMDAEFIAPFEQLGKSVHVSEASEQSVDVRVP
jgi:hypothetical protein